jgi:type VI protein secretion system component VasK
LSYRRSQTTAGNATATLENLCAGIQERVNAINEQAAQMRHPFAGATERALVSDYARNKEYHADAFELALREGRSYSEKLLNLYCRALARLVTICETVERIAA